MSNHVPTTSNQYLFLPSTGELGLNAFARIQIRRAELTEEHMQNLRVSANLMLADWSVDIPNLWTIDLQEIDLIPGQETYAVDPTTVAILDAYIRINATSDNPTDRIIYPVSRTEYASFPNKEQPGFPTCYWMDRLLSPTLTLWHPPDDSQPYVLRFYRCVQFQDANLVSAQNAQIPPRFFEAFASGLAAKLAEIYNPQMVPQLDAKALRAWQRASQQDIETNVPLYIFPGLSGYWR